MAIHQTRVKTILELAIEATNGALQYNNGEFQGYTGGQWLDFATKAWVTGNTFSTLQEITDNGNTTNQGIIITSGGLTTNYFTDGFLEITTAQINRNNGAVELQFNPDHSSERVNIFGNKSYETTWDPLNGNMTVNAALSVLNDINITSGRINHLGELYIEATSNIRNQANIHTWSNAAGTTEYARFLSDGALLINASSTSLTNKLFIEGKTYSTNGFEVGTSTTPVGKLYNLSGNLTLEADGTRDIQIGNSSTNTQMIFIEGTNGNVGIGIASPTEALHVSGNTLIQNTTSSGNTVFAVDGTFGRLFSITDDLTGSLFSINTIAGLPVVEAFADNTVTLGSYSRKDFYLDGSTGYIGLGTDTPDAPLHIVTTNTADGFVFTGSDGKDFVKIHHLGYLTTRASDTNGANIHFRDNNNSKRMEIAVNSTQMRWYSDALSGNFMVFQHTTGNIGINTLTPSEKLEVNEGFISTSGSGPNTSGFRLKRDSQDTYDIVHLDGGLTIYNNTDARKEMTFLGNGNVGINTTSPTNKLHISSSSGTIQRWDITTANADGVGAGLFVYTNAAISPDFLGGFRLDYNGGISSGNRRFEFFLGDSVNPRMSIDGSGNVGIGTNSPSEKLHVVGNILADSDITANGLFVFSAAASGSLASRDGFSDFMGYDPSYGSYIGGGAGNATRYLYAGGFINNGSGVHQLFHDAYHPNADVLTTARTISLSGDTTGSVSFDGSADVTIGVTITNDSHTHDNRYYTETEIGNFFDGTTSINGYNKSNWDSAYNDILTGATFNTGNGLITLTRRDLGTISVDIDGRYLQNAFTSVADSSGTTWFTASGSDEIRFVGDGDTSVSFDAGTNTVTIFSQVGIGSGTSGVVSFKNRTGAVNPASGDYTTTLVEEGSNLYFTDQRAIDALTGSTVWNGANWDTAYGWGDWSTGVNKTFVDALNVDSDTLDGQHGSYYTNASNISTGTLNQARLPVSTSTLRTIEGSLTVESNSDGILILKQLGISGTGGVKNAGWNYIEFDDSEGDRMGYFGFNSSGEMQLSSEINGVVKIGSNRIFDDGYHPNADTLTTARSINGTSFNGSANITTATWGASRNITIGDTLKSVNGGSNVSWTITEIGITKTNIDALGIDATHLGGAAANQYLRSTSNPATPGPGNANTNISIGDNSTNYAYVQSHSKPLRLNPVGNAVEIGAGNTVFHDGYHPNADALTTARTITLGGDVTGSVSFDGSSNVTITTTVTNDSHTHDDRYYTETEINNFFGGAVSISGYSQSNWDSAYNYSQVGHLPLSGGSVTGDVTISGNLGVGELSPSAKLDVAGSARIDGDITFTGGGFIRNNGTTSMEIEAVGGDVILTPHTTGNVGINVDNPDYKLHIDVGANASFIPGLLISNPYVGEDGQSTGLLFNIRNSAGSELIKGGIAYEQTNGWGRGSIHFLNNSVDSTGIVGLADAKMTIDTNGLIGIGTTSPNTLLHIYDDTISTTGVTDLLKIEGSLNDISTTPNEIAIVFKVQDSNNLTNEARIKMATVNDTDFGDNDEAASNLIFSTTNGGVESDKMIITGRGNVGVGKLNPTTLLDVNGVITATGGDSTEWNTAYDERITSASIVTRQLVLTKPGGTNITVTLDNTHYHSAANITSGELNKARVRAINIPDTRSTHEAPDDFDREVKFDFKFLSTVSAPTTTNATYGGLMTIAPWSDNSGDAHHQLFFAGDGDGTTNGYIAWRTGDASNASTTGWGDWKKLWTENDFTSTNVTNWTAAYNEKINNINLTNGVLILTQQDTNTLSVNLDSRYFTETEINNRFAGNTAVTGYNKSNWDSAYTYSQIGHVEDAFKTVLNGSGVTQFTASGEDAIRFEGGGDTTVSFDAVTNTITITSVVGSGSGATGVSLFNGRAGVVSPQSGDYNTTIVAEGSNLYYTDARARAAISVSGDLSYNSGTGVVSFTETDPVFSASEASNITATDTSNWDTAFSWGDHDSRYIGVSNNSVGGLIVSDATDLNNWNTTRVARATGSNEPSTAVQDGAVLNLYADSNQAVQIWFGLFGDRDIYLRNRNGGNFGGWTKFWAQHNDGAGSGLDADLLDGQQGSYYLDYNNFTNTPTIPTVNNNTITITGSNGLSGSGSFTLNQSSNVDITLSHADTSALSGNYGGNNNGIVIEDITVDSNGHVTAVGTRDLDDRFTLLDHHRSLGVITINNGVNPNITTAQFISQIETAGAFDSYTSSFKSSWDYGGNYNLTDAGSFTETAGVSFLTWTDNSNDSTRGNITILAISPTTGGSAGKVHIYNDQGSGYSPGWREVWTSTSDGAGSGLDADLLDGQQGSYYLDYNNFTNTPTIPTVNNNTITVNGNNGLTGSGSFTLNQSSNVDITLSHADTSSQASINNSNGTVIQDITLDGYGHITAIGSVNLDSRYFTETEINNRFAGTTAVTGYNKSNWDAAYTYSQVGHLEDGFTTVADSGGTTRFSASGSSQIRFEGSGDTTVLFDASTNKVIINSEVGSGSGATGVSTFNGRAGAVVPASNDYTTSLVAEGTRLYYTNARARAAISATGDLSYNSTTGVMSFTESDPIFTSSAAFGITSSDILEWNSAYNDSITGITFNTGNGIITYNQADNTTLTVDIDGRFSLLGHTHTHNDITDFDTEVNALINAIVNNPTITISAGSALSGSGSFTLNQSSNVDITLEHGNTSNLSGNYGGNNNGIVVEDVTVDTYGHVTAVGTRDLDSRYYTETEIGNFFDGTTSINGYNKSNWDATYNEKINSIELTNGVLILTQQDTTTLSVNLDSRYELTGHTHTHTDITDFDTEVNTLINAIVGDGTITIQGSNGLSGSGNFTTNQGGNTTITLSHPTTIGTSSNANGNGVGVQNITIDDYGHITNIGTYNFDTRYYNKTDIANFFSGTSGITGYNRVNWNTAYGWGDHSAEGYQTNAFTTIANNNGVSQFTASGSDEIRFAGGGDTSVSFNAATNTITITSIVGSGTGTTGVSSFNSRVGAVVATSGDYTTTIVEEGTNLYFTYQRAIDAITGSTVWNGSNWDSAYTYSQIGHLPTSGGSLSGDLIIGEKALPRLILDSLPSGDNFTSQGAQISLGESGNGTASLHLTYTGDGRGYIGMGAITNGIPAFSTIRFNWNTNDIRFLSTPNVNGSTVWHAGNDGAGSGLDADLLDNQQGSYYLDYNNFTNTPTIPTVNNATITINTSSGLTGSGSFTLNQIGNTTITVSHANTSNLLGLTGGNGNGVVIEDITVDTYGHVTAIGTVDLDSRYIQSETDTLDTVTDRGNITTNSISVGNITLTTVANQGSEDTALVINNSGIVGFRELGSNAFTNTNYLSTIGLTDGTTNSTIPDNGTNLTIQGDNVITSTLVGTTFTLTHAATAASSVDNSNGLVIQDVTLDDYGHITGLSSVDLDTRYPTYSASANRIAVWSTSSQISFDTNLYWNFTSNRMGINETDPLANIHIVKADSSLISPNARANQLVVDESEDAGMSILSTTLGTLAFGDENSALSGQLIWDSTGVLGPEQTFILTTEGNVYLEAGSVPHIILDSSNGLTLPSIDNMSGETAALVISNTDVVGFRELGGLAFENTNSNLSISGTWTFNSAIQQSSNSATLAGTTSVTYSVPSSRNVITLTAPSTLTGTLTLSLPAASSFKGQIGIIIINQGTGTGLEVTAAGGTVYKSSGTFLRTDSGRDVVTALSDGNNWYVVLANNLS